MASNKEILSKLQTYLNCPCQYFEPMQDDAPLREAYQKACQRGQAEGFVPVFVVIEDELFRTLWDTLLINVNEDPTADLTFDTAAVAAYRQKMFAKPLADGQALLDEWFLQWRGELELDGWDWEKDILGVENPGETLNQFLGYWNHGDNATYPLILVEIPVKNPWEIFAYLPFGGWNQCPGTEELMAIAKHWYESCSAVPALITHDVLEFNLPKPVAPETSLTIAQEQFAFCPDIIDPDTITMRTLADELTHSTDCFFWWD